MKKWISALMVLCFVSTNVFAQVPLALPPNPGMLASKLPAYEIQIPSELGSVIHRSAGSGPLVIHIQDAHAQYEAQVKIQKILGLLTRQHGVRLVGLEGGAGNLHPEYFRVTPDKKKNAQILDRLVREGELSGSEFFAIQEDGKNAPAWIGLEDPELYRKDLELFQSAFRKSGEHQGFFSTLKNEIAKLKARVFSENLRKFDAAKTRFDERRVDFIRYGRFLQKAASRFLRLDLANPKEQKEFPILVRIAILERTEAGVQKNAAQIDKEKTALRRALKNFDWNAEALPRRFYERLYGACQKQKINLDHFPAFKEFAKYEILKSEIDAQSLFAEIASLEKKIYDSLIRTPEERQLLDRSRGLALAEKFVRLEVTRQEASEFQASKPALFGDLKPITSLIQEAGRFYELAQERDEVLVARLLEKARERKLSRVVLVSGGFHTEGIQRILADQKIALMTIAPKLSGTDQTNNYHRVIMNGKLWFERPAYPKVSSPRVSSSVRRPSHKDAKPEGTIAQSKIPSAGKIVERAFYASMNPGDPGRQERIIEWAREQVALQAASLGEQLEGEHSTVSDFGMADRILSHVPLAPRRLSRPMVWPALTLACAAVFAFSMTGDSPWYLDLRFASVVGGILSLGYWIHAGRSKGSASARSLGIISTPVAEPETKRLLRFEDIQPGKIAFDRYDKLIPLAVNFLRTYGGSKPEYQRLRPLAGILEHLTIKVGSTPGPSTYDYDEVSKILTLNQEFVDFLFRTGRKKIAMSWLADIADYVQSFDEDTKRVRSEDHLDLKILIAGGKQSLTHQGETRLDDTKRIFDLKKKMALNDTPEAPVTPERLTEDDVLLIISDYLHRGRILDAPRLRRMLRREFGYYGEFPVKKLEEVLEKFFGTHKDKIQRREVITKDDIESLKKKLAEAAEISMADVTAKVTKTTRYSFTRKYLTDPAFKDRLTVWDVEAERQDEVDFGGKTAHTGELMFTPRAVTLENFATGSQGFQSLINHNTADVFTAQLMKNIEGLKSLIQREGEGLDIPVEELAQKADSGDRKSKALLAHLTALRVVLDGDSKGTVKEQLDEALEVYAEVLFDLQHYYKANGIREYFTKLGNSLDDLVRNNKFKRADVEDQLDKAKARLTELKNEIKKIEEARPEDAFVKQGKEIKNSRKEADKKHIEAEIAALESLAQRFQRQFEEITITHAKKFLLAARNLVVPPALENEIKENLKLLAERLGLPVDQLVLAIRSSAVGEDSEEASFAGRQDTYIFVTATPPDVVRAVNEISRVQVDPSGLDNLIASWVFNQASLFNKRAIDYRFDKGLPTFDDHVEISTLFQRMFPSQLSFIAFSVNRKTGFPSMSMNITEGQGELLVSGQEAGSEYIVSQDGEIIIVREKGERNFKIVETPDRRHKVRIRLRPEERAEFSVTDPELIKEAARYFRTIDEFYDEGYVDLEGAFRSKEDDARQPIPLMGSRGAALKDPRGKGRWDWNIVSTQARPETVFSLQDPDVIKLKKIVVTDAAYEKAKRAGRVLPFSFIAKTGGTAQGEVAWVLDKTDPNELAKAKGKILATRQSDPDMNSAMISAKGIVAILGGQNSHTMIVATEYGLVAITGTDEQLMSVLKEGTEITIDAERGKILLGYDHDLKVAGRDFSARDIPDTPFGSTRSSTIVASRDKSMSQHPLRNIPTYKGVGLKRLEIDLAFIEAYTDALLAYDNMKRKERGEPITEGEVLDSKKDKELIEFIESKIAGFNSGQDFYETVITEGILATTEPLNPDYEEVASRYQQIQAKDLRLAVKDIVDQIYREGLGHNSDPLLAALTILHEAQNPGSLERKMLEEIIGLLDKRLYVRLDDRKSDEYKGVKGAELFVKEELNPMKGFRGLTLLLDSPTLKWQLRTMIQVAKLHRHKIAVFAPIVRRPGDFKALVEKFLAVGEELGLSKTELANLVEIGMMTEIPTNSVYIEDYLRVVQEFRDQGIPIRFFTSTGGNDGLQTIYRIDRNTGDLSLKNNATGYSPAVLRWNARIAAQAKKKNEEAVRLAKEAVKKGDRGAAYRTLAQIVETGYCGNDPSVPGQEEYGRGLACLGYKSVSVVIEQYEKVARNLALDDVKKLGPKAEARYRLFGEAKGFNFEIDPAARPSVQDSYQVNLGDILMGMEAHYQLLADYDAKKLEVKKTNFQLEGEKLALEAAIGTLDRQINANRESLQKLTEQKDKTRSRDAKDQLEAQLTELREKTTDLVLKRQAERNILDNVNYDLETIEMKARLKELLRTKGYEPETEGMGMRYFHDRLSDGLRTAFEEARRQGKRLVIGTDDAPTSSLIRDGKKQGGMRGLVGGHRYEPLEANPDYGVMGVVKNVNKKRKFFSRELRVIQELKNSYADVPLAMTLRVLRTYTDVNEVLAFMKEAGLIEKISLFETPSKHGFRLALRELERAGIVQLAANGHPDGVEAALQALEKRDMIRGENRVITDEAMIELLRRMSVALVADKVISSRAKIDYAAGLEKLKELGYVGGGPETGDVPLGIDVQVAANLFELPELLDPVRRIAFLTLPDAEEFAGELMALERGNINGDEIHPEDLVEQNAKPIQILATAAAKRGIPFTLPAAELAKTQAQAASLGQSAQEAFVKRLTHPDAAFREVAALGRRWVEALIPAEGIAMPDGTVVTRITDAGELPEKVLRPYWHDHVAIVVARNKTLGYTAYIGLHHLLPFNGSLYGAVGGIRRKQWPSEEDAMISALTLSLAMSRKNASIGLDMLPLGGSKTMLNVDMSITGDLLKEIYTSLGRVLDRFPLTTVGNDMNTGPVELGYVALAAPSRVAGHRDSSLKGDYPSPWTARGVFAGIKEAVKAVFGDEATLKGRVFAVQGGAGAVGSTLVELLVGEGARVVIADMPDKLDAVRKAYPDGRVEILDDPDKIYDVHDAIFSPNGPKGILNEKTIARLKAAGVKLVAGAANDQLATPEDARRLQEAGIAYAVDYVINGGGVSAVFTDALSVNMPAIIEAIGTRVGHLIRESQKQNIPPTAIADAQADLLLSAFDAKQLEPAREIVEQAERASIIRRALPVGPDTRLYQVRDASVVMINPPSMREHPRASLYQARIQLQRFLETALLKVVLALGEFPPDSEDWKKSRLDKSFRGLRNFPATFTDIEARHQMRAYESANFSKLGELYKEAKRVMESSLEKLQSEYARLLEALALEGGTKTSLDLDAVRARIIAELSTQAELEDQIGVLLTGLRPEDVKERILAAYGPVESGGRVRAISPELAEFRLGYIREAIQRVTGLEAKDIHLASLAPAPKKPQEVVVVVEQILRTEGRSLGEVEGTARMAGRVIWREENTLVFDFLATSLGLTTPHALQREISQLVTLAKFLKSGERETMRRIVDYRDLPQTHELDEIILYAQRHPEVEYHLLTVASESELARLKNRLGPLPVNFEIHGVTSKAGLIPAVRRLASKDKTLTGFVTQDPVLAELGYRRNLLRVAGSSDSVVQNATVLVTADKLREELPLALFFKVQRPEDLGEPGLWDALVADLRALHAVQMAA